MQTIEKIQKHAQAIAAGDIENVRPGMPATFTAACVAGDCIAQGDLDLILVDEVPSGYSLVKKPKASDKQLVPGNTQGAKHCLDSLQGITLYRPRDWTDESLDGPCLVLTEDRTILHPVHGQVAVLAGTTVLCKYQREYDKEQQRERRTRD